MQKKSNQEKAQDTKVVRIPVEAYDIIAKNSSYYRESFGQILLRLLRDRNTKDKK